jgi:hypothetical protein
MSAVTELKTPSNRRIATTIVAVTLLLGIGFAAGGFMTGGFDNDIRVPAAKVETVTTSRGGGWIAERTLWLSLAKPQATRNGEV